MMNLLQVISLPVILTSQTSQEIMARGTLIWDAAFSSAVTNLAFITLFLELVKLNIHGVGKKSLLYSRHNFNKYWPIFGRPYLGRAYVMQSRLSVVIVVVVVCYILYCGKTVHLS